MFLGLTEFWAPKFKVKIRGTISEIEIGQHRISKEQADHNISKTAKGVIYAEGAVTKLHEPNQRWNADNLEAIKA